MLYTNLSAKLMYASIPNRAIIEKLFATGLEIGSTELAVSAMEELISRGDTVNILGILDSAFKEGHVKIETSMSGMIGRSLSESCRGNNLLLQRFGKFLYRRAKTNDPVDEFLADPDEKSFFEGKNLLRLFTGYVPMEDFLRKGIELSDRANNASVEHPMDQVTPVSVGQVVDELELAREMKDSRQELCNELFLEGMKKILSDSGMDPQALDRWSSKVTPDKLSKLREAIMNCG